MVDKNIIIKELREAIKVLRDDINTQPGSLTNDVILTPLTDVVYKQQTRSQLVSIFQSMQLILDLKNDSELLTSTAEILDMTSSELEAELKILIEKSALNWGVTRRDPTKATGVVYFYRYYAPGDATVVVISSGTVVSKVDGVEYVTTSAATLTNASPYSNILNSNYEEVPIEAVVAGTSGNAVERTIIQHADSLNVDGVTNLDAIDNGLNEQTDDELVETVQTKLTGNNIGVEDGYISLISDNFSYVDELLLVGPNDSEMQRSQYGGEIDVYVKGSIPQQTTDTITTILGETEYLLPNVPVDEDKDVNIAGYVEDADYELQKDTGILVNSAKAQDKVKWTGAVPPVGTWDVQYTYNKLMSDIQSFLEDIENKIVTSDILAREAEEVTADISFTISLFSGYAFDTVKAEIETALGNYIFALGLNDDLLIADIITIVQPLTAVENITDVEINSLEQDLQADRRQYITAGTITITQA